MSGNLSIEESTVQVTPIDVKVEVNVNENVVQVSLGNVGPQGPRGTQVLSGNTNPSINIGLIGDQYINTITGKLFGPKISSGWGEGVYIGSSDPNDMGQVYNQTSPSTEWDIAHTLTFIPNIIVVDTENNVIEGDYQYIDSHHIVAKFSRAIMGKAYLS
jgi:hypothetical protein